MSDEELAKDLGLVSAMTIGIGTMIGAGIFVLPGVAARAAGPVVVLSFVVGVIAMMNALSLPRLASLRTSLLLAERPRSRSLRERLFG